MERVLWNVFKFSSTTKVPDLELSPFPPGASHEVVVYRVDIYRFTAHMGAVYSPDSVLLSAIPYLKYVTIKMRVILLSLASFAMMMLGW